MHFFFFFALNMFFSLFLAMKEGKEGRFFTHMAIPTQKDIELALLERKKRELLTMYAIDDDEEEEEVPKKKSK